MKDDDFLKEKQNIRQKMLQYSRAIKEGKKPEFIEFEEESLKSDDILKRRIKSPKNKYEFLEIPTEKPSIYLKEDLINVKLEEKQGLISGVFSRIQIKNLKIPKRQKTNQQKIKKTQEKIHLFSKLKQKKNLNLKFILKLKPEKFSLIKIKKEENKQKDQASIQVHPILKEQTHCEKLSKNIDENFNSQSSQIEVHDNSLETKNTLLEGYKIATKEEVNLNKMHLLFAFLILIFALFIFTPQIYIRNNIYYLSRDIAVLRSQEAVLNEENKELKRHLENMRFQNQILDYLE